MSRKSGGVKAVTEGYWKERSPRNRSEKKGNETVMFDKSMNCSIVIQAKTGSYLFTSQFNFNPFSNDLSSPFQTVDWQCQQQNGQTEHSELSRHNGNRVGWRIHLRSLEKSCYNVWNLPFQLFINKDDPGSCFILWKTLDTSTNGTDDRF